MILLKPELFQELDGTLPGLQSAVRSAIQLEHATIPVYLYALYSIKQGTNTAAAQILKKIVVEEMFHMAIACNLLNAIGDAPHLNRKGFVPQYPGPLPGGVEQGLIVHLAPLSLDRVVNEFMNIEEPEDPIIYRMTAAVGAPQEPLTIGRFYQKIAEQLKPEYFTGDPARQLELKGYVPRITGLENARTGITSVVEQGEGTKEGPTDEEKQMAHYYRFSEIDRGKKLIKNPHAGPNAPIDERYIYAGDPVPLDAGSIIPLALNPKGTHYPAGSAAAVANDRFNNTYSTLLNSLQMVFDGRPTQFNSAIGIMESLKEQALFMTRVPLGDGTFAGPTFELDT